MNRLMGPGGIQGPSRVEGGTIRQLDAIRPRQVSGPIPTELHRHGPAAEHRLCSHQPLRLGPQTNPFSVRLVRSSQARGQSWRLE